MINYYYLGNGNDNVTYNDNAEIQVDAGNGANTIQYNGPFKAAIIGGTGVDIFVGNNGDDSLYGAEGADFLNGAGGSNYIEGNGGADTIWANPAGPGGQNYVKGGSGNDTITTGSDVDIIFGGDGSDSIRGGGGTDVINGNAESVSDDGTAPGVDQIFGEDGNDQITISGGSFAFGGFDNDSITSVGAGQNYLVGEFGDDTLISGIGDDVLNGGFGLDSMVGGLGNDNFFVNRPDDIVKERAGEGFDAVWTDGDYILPANIEVGIVLAGFTGNLLGNELDNALLGSNLNNNMAGGLGGDFLHGGGGNDVLDGGLGADFMDGGPGTDQFFVDDAGDVVVDLGELNVFDTVFSTVSFVLPVNVEIFIAQGAGNINGVGNDGITLLLGNAGNNALAGLGGNDVILGQDGDDAIDGGTGNDIISGGAGSDTLAGGANNDTFVYQVFSEGGSRGDVISDFTTGFGVNGDILDLKPLFATFAPGFGTTSTSAIISGHLTFTQSGADTFVFVDPNGGVHNPGEQVFLALLQNVNANALQANTLVI